MTLLGITYDLTPILVALLTLFGAIVTSFLVPWIKSKTNANKQQFINELIKMGVLAAEQIYKDTNGAKKMEYVINFLKSKGIKIDEDELKVMIEAAVKKLEGGLLIQH